MEGKMVIVGPRSAPRKKDDLTRMILPFELWAWLSIVIVFISFSLLWVLVAWAFTGTLSLRRFLQLAVGEYEIPPPPEQPEIVPRRPNMQENFRLMRMTAIAVLRSSFKLFLGTTIIFYDVLIAYYILERWTQTLTIDLQGLTKAELSEYAVIEGAAQEFVLRETVDPERKYDNGTVPWHRCRNLEDCYEKLLDETHPAKFMVTYDFAVRFHLRKIKACNRLAVYDTQLPLFAFNGVWYLNSNVPGYVHVAVDRSISTLRLKDEMRRILSRAVHEKTPMDCGKQTPRIPGGFLGRLFAIVLVPPGILIVVVVVVACAIRIAARRLMGPGNM